MLKIVTHYAPDRVVYRLFDGRELLGVYASHWEAVEAKAAKALESVGVFVGMDGEFAVYRGVSL
jgi:hypothetical protein